MKLSNHLFRILDQYKIALAQHFRAQQLSLSPLHYKVLQLIHAHDPATPQLIAQQSGRDKAQVTRLLQEMEKQGLIEKQPHPTDKRSICLALTPLACDRVSQAEQLAASLDEQLCALLEPAEVQQLQRLLCKIEKGLGSTG
ncbi:MarR family transcriptional regulator [Aeromonas taiwanensis]|uniref:MarR family transcriptional regulator n=1 Tax=Aeromonas taiwanensis TaxID=633417 RepID=A0A5F0KCV7_9GAMM|nr:MarR family transcriptional regulator [Aeromonas taiwanensis]TFF78151.1 MarR family transcriptional regulator [Aeromonas taiwanensis]TFF78635.1 MarR family transcriptional regulator [Aeromonas taiwanensis]TFF82391.1 MarR family transcriptional regulator [Aeromonas taiwanensis]